MSWKIGSYDGFNIFDPAPESVPEGRKHVEETIRANRRYLAERTDEEKTKTPMKITGSFIYAHAPDYVGGHTLDYGKTDWDRAFCRLKSKGIDTVVFQASVWNELQEVYYKSGFFSSFRCWNVVEPMLCSAKENGLTVFLGGYGSVSGWNVNLSDSDILEEIGRQTGCFSELLSFRDLFDGVYYSPETAFPGVRDLKREERLHWIYQNYFRKIKELAPEKKILMSPSSFWIPGKSEDFTASWQALLDDVPLDILAPQDSIGCSSCKLEYMADVWSLWHQITQRNNISLWANIELFERVEFGGRTPFITASPERILQQCREVAPYVQKCICWEALYFDFPGTPDK